MLQAPTEKSSLPFRRFSRRAFFSRAAMVACGTASSATSLLKAQSREPEIKEKALIAISLDLEMARNFPRWEDTHWDYEKGNLNEETKQYAVEAARRAHARGAVIHFFLVCRALEQENVNWLKEILSLGHKIGNHTYDHVYLLASKPEETQYRFQRAPWLVEGKSTSQIVRENILLAGAALKSRLGIAPCGFRAPGGFADGLSKHPSIQKILMDAGYSWVSAKYPAHPNSQPGTAPSTEVFDGILKAQLDAQPFVYSSGLTEIPMSPISDIGAFRNGRWKLPDFLKATRMSIQWAIDHGKVFDFLAHPACLYAMDPEFRAIELICELVEKSADRAKIVSLQDIAQTVSHHP